MFLLNFMGSSCNYFLFCVVLLRFLGISSDLCDFVRSCVICAIAYQFEILLGYSGILWNLTGTLSQRIFLIEKCLSDENETIFCFGRDTFS